MPAWLSTEKTRGWRHPEDGKVFIRWPTGLRPRLFSISEFDMKLQDLRDQLRDAYDPQFRGFHHLMARRVRTIAHRRDQMGRPDPGAGTGPTADRS